MREIARRLALRRRVAGAALAAAATLTTVAALGAPSALAATTVSVTTSFENTPVSLSTSDAVGYAIANTSGSTQTVSFTDTLPAGVTLDNPIGTTNTAGGGSCSSLTVTNPSTGQPSNPGDGAVTVSLKVPSVTGSSSSKPVCTISLGVVANAASGDVAIKDAYSNVSPAGTATTPGGIIVLSNPTLSVSAPSNNQSFVFGSTVDANFSCAVTDPLDTIDSFFGTDDDGNEIQSGAPIDTVDPGAHSLEFDCYSIGGGDVTETINYKVGSYTLSAIRANRKNQQVSFKTTVPAGKLVATVLDGKKKVGTTTVKIPARKAATVTVKPTAAGRKLLSATKGNTARLTLQVAFTPTAIGTGDSQISPQGATTLTKNVNLPIVHPKPKRKAKKKK